MQNLRKKLFALFLIGLLVSFMGVSKFAFADDEEERSESSESEDENDEEDEAAENAAAQEEESPEEETIVQKIKLPDTIITRTIIENITKYDSDRDGLLDENDPHPEIAEIYVVKDEDRNGIDDRYDLK